VFKKIVPGEQEYTLNPVMNPEGRIEKSRDEGKRLVIVDDKDGTDEEITEA
jgi:hypothetical protein